MSHDDPQGDSWPEHRASSDDPDITVDQWIDLFEEPVPVEPEGPRSGARREESGGWVIGSGQPDRSAQASGGGPVDDDPHVDDRRWLGRSLSRRLPEDRAADESHITTIEAWQRAQERSRRQARVRANQRAARQMQRLLPDRGPVETPLARMSGPIEGGQTAAVRRLSVVAGGLLILVVGLVGYLFIDLGSTDGPPSAAPSPFPADVSTQLELPVGAAAPPASLEELVQATVLVVGLDDEMQAQCAGSGVVVSSDGTILTNAHVVLSSDACRFGTLGVAVTADSGTPPQLLYEAEVEVVQLEVDLAVLRIVGPLTEGNNAPWPTTFTAAPLGDSDTVELADSLRILGYPVIGGNTITVTVGTVSGFTSQVGLGNRALIKTDATILAGNSGGLAVDEDGRVVGIPTKARASEQGPAIDCRPINDTNADGTIDELDTCVPVGGFLNGVRPINLSLGLLAAAGVSDPVQSADAAPSVAEVDLDQVVLSNPRFSLDQTADGRPISDDVTASAGAAQLCFSVDVEGDLPNGLQWDGVWYIDGERESRQTFFLDGAMANDDRPRPLGLCHEAPDEAGLAAGIYQLAFYLGGRQAFVEGFEITPEPVEVVSIEWVNDTEVDLCALAINPQAELQQIGLDELPRDTIIAPGERWTTELPVGQIVVEASDCSGDVVANNFNGLPVTVPQVFSIQPDAPES